MIRQGFIYVIKHCLFFNYVLCIVTYCILVNVDFENVGLVTGKLSYIYNVDGALPDIPKQLVAIILQKTPFESTCSVDDVHLVCNSSIQLHISVLDYIVWI